MPFLLDLRAQTMHSYELAVGIYPTPARIEARVMAHFESAEIVEWEGQAIGILKVVREPSHWHLVQIQLLPSHQGRGIGGKLVEGFVLALSLLCAAVSSPAYAQDRLAILRAVALDIEKLKPDFPQLADFTAAAHVQAEPPSIGYSFRTRAPEATGGWTSGVPAPDADGIWFHIDLHDPASTLQIHTQPVTAPLCLGTSRVSFLMRNGRDTRSPYGPIWNALAKQGARTCDRIAAI